MSVFSVCMKKSICVFSVEEEKIGLTVLFRSVAENVLLLHLRFDSVRESVCSVSV